MQDPHKVKLVDASPETREKLKIFQSGAILRGCTLEGKRIKTLEDAVLFAIEQAERVPELEKENSELRAAKFELEKDNSRLQEDIKQLKEKNKELENEIERIELQHEVDMTEYDTGEDE